MTFASALLTALLLTQAAPRLFAVEPAKSLLRYNVVHTLHKVSGETATTEGKVAVKPDGTAQVMIRASIVSFKSGDANRDEHMQETMESAKFGQVLFKGVTRITPPETFPSTVKFTVEGELEFHGVKGRESVPLTVEFTSAKAAHITGSFNVSLDKYKVERPSLLLMKIDDACKIDVDLLLVEAIR